MQQAFYPPIDRRATAVLKAAEARSTQHRGSHVVKIARRNLVVADEQIDSIAFSKVPFRLPFVPTGVENSIQYGRRGLNEFGIVPSAPRAVANLYLTVLVAPGHDHRKRIDLVDDGEAAFG